jgi:starch synthase
MVSDRLKILFIVSEMVPFAKTGGLADVAGALPKALKRLGTDVRCILPFYGSLKIPAHGIRPVLKGESISLGQETIGFDILETRGEGETPVTLIRQEALFSRPGLYGESGRDYPDNLKRFGFFAHAALRAAGRTGFEPHVIHCHDWQTGLVPALLNLRFRKQGAANVPRSLFTIHNIGYQGLFPEDDFPLTGLPRDAYYHVEGLEYWGKLSLLKAGVIYSDAVTTVSPKYAQEIQTPEFGMGMEGVLAKRRGDLFGVLNGADYDVWDPGKDGFLTVRFGPGSLSEKRACKKALAQEMGLSEKTVRGPLFGMITRIDRQKGLDLVVDNLRAVMGLGAGLVILGTGDPGLQRDLEKGREAFPGRIGLRIGFDESLAHRIMAGVDFFLIPSRYEPCGLTQMYALKYGTVPVVRATGGLDDTVIHYERETRSGNGIKFQGYDSLSFLGAVKEAVRLFHDPDHLAALQMNGMRADFSWEKSAARYLKLYSALLKGAGERIS